MSKKIGVFVCHCGTNISATVDVEKVAEEARKKNPGVSLIMPENIGCKIGRASCRERV